MGEEEAERVDAQRELIRWQRMLMPVMVVLLLGLAVFFFATSYWQYERMENHIQQTVNERGITESLAAYERTPGVSPDFDYIRWKSLTIQDDRAQIARFHRANAALLVSVWTRNLGFVTGMILAVVGAAFVMAKLSEGPTALNAESGPVKAALSTSSPGIILAVLGTALMMMAMSVRYQAETREPILAPTVQPGAGGNSTADPDLDPPAPAFPTDPEANATDG